MMSWPELVTLIVVFVFALLALVGLLSYNHGVVKERRRAESLCHQAIQKRGRVSGTLRWVWHAIGEGRTTLMDEDEFFND